MLKLFTQYKGLKRENYILFFGRIVTNLGSMIWPVMTLILNQKMGLSASGVALVMIIFGALQLPLSLVAGKMADKYNKKMIIVICDAIAIAFYIICGCIKLSWVSMGMLFIAATLESMEGPAYNSLVADITPTKDRERAYSLLYLGANIGLIASPTLAGLLFKNYLWLSFIISGIAIGSSTILIFFFVKDITPVDESEDESAVYQKSEENVSAWKILKANGPLLLYLIVTAFYYGAYNQYGYLMPLDMARVHGDQGAVIFGTVSSVNCIVVVIFTPIITSLLSKVSYTVKSLISMLLVLIGYGVFLLGLGHVPFYYAAIILFTWGEILSTISSGPYMTERMPASHRGRINAVMGVFQSILVGVLMYAAGFIYDGLGSTVAWIGILGILGIAAIGNVVLIFADRKFYPALYKKNVKEKKEKI